MIAARWLDGNPYAHPISKVVCVGRNYAAHAKELNNPVPNEPLLFIKPNTAISALEGELVLPGPDGAIHYETELALLIGAKLNDSTDADAQQAIVGIGLALDLTNRDLQSRLKEKGHPWEKAKAFDGSCPLSRFVPWEIRPLQALSFKMYKNEKLVQHGSTDAMVTPIISLVRYISSHFTLLPGDIVLTGTPEGVGSLQGGDRLLFEGPGGLQCYCTVVSGK